MNFKRKRSDSTASPASTSSNFSRSSVSPSPPHQYFSNTMELGALAQALPTPAHSWTQQPMNEGKNASGRTMKRFRDSRPDERLIHESTLRRLYNAQREQPNASPMPYEEPPDAAESDKLPVQKSTLHNFWNIPQSPARQSAVSLPSVTNSAEGTRSHNCSTSLAADETMDMDMDGPVVRQ
ncbi:hypothetical protein B0J12DRAFT_113462 [Macrophomina phaseolina]|uniref:Uncharacterized protein n=1 Tax=Macrophomina phaseolina TaxID=35725 RepID=A0ABQ8G8Q4_9PEZI|nr:hypothetical protein B0J12DRAFT_113462 [Macrophomina phaseolina]